MIWFILTPLVLLLVITLVRVIGKDGYGSRPPPRSHLGSESATPYYDLRIVA